MKRALAAVALASAVVAVPGPASADQVCVYVVTRGPVKCVPKEVYDYPVTCTDAVANTTQVRVCVPKPVGNLR